MALKKVTLDGIEYTQEILQKNVDGNIPYMDKIYGSNPVIGINHNERMSLDQLNFQYGQTIENQINKFGFVIKDERGIPVDDDKIIINNLGIPQPAPKPAPSGIPPCDTVPWIEVNRKFKSSSISGRLILYNKYRLPFKYDKKNQKLLPDDSETLTGINSNASFMIPQSKIISMTILNLDNRVYLKEGMHYRIDQNNLIWIRGTAPYKNLDVKIEWYDTRTSPWTYNVNNFTTQTILDTGVLNNRVNKKVYVVTQSEKVTGENFNFVDNIENISKYNIVNPTVSGLISSNNLGPWRQPILYIINGGECHVRVEIDGKLTYLNSNGAPTTAEAINVNTLSKIDLLSSEIAEFQTGQILDGKTAKGLFQIVEPNVDTVNFSIQRDISFTERTGIKRIDVKIIDEKTYESFPADSESELPVGLRMYIDVRKLEPVPYRDCYEGLRTEYLIHEEYEIHWERQQPCIADPLTGEVVMQYRTTTEKVEKTIVDWEDQVLNSSLPDCDCLDIIVENEPFQTEVPNCGCREITTANFYTICRGGVREDIFRLYASAADKDKKVYGMPEPPDVRPYLVDKTVKIAKCKSVTVEDRDSYIYHQFPETDMIKAHLETETRGLFDDQEYVDCYTTSSLQTSSLKKYYYEVIGC